jgi:integrase
VVEALGMPGPHFHDLRHTGNQFAANSGADKAITDAIDVHVDDETRRDGGDDGMTGGLVTAV